MGARARAPLALALASLLLACAAGCARPAAEEDAWRREVEGAISSLENAVSFRYRLHLETWTGVSGQSVYGSERGEGHFLNGDYRIALTRSSPQGEEDLAFDSSAARHAGAGRAAEEGLLAAAPNPLYDPLAFTRLLSPRESLSLQGEEERGGAACRRYLLRLGEASARAAMTAGAWSYFSDLRFEITCTLWVSDPREPPASLRLEIVGLDAHESLQRYRALATLDLREADPPQAESAPAGG